jgi:serine-type D-Ala-D-Ala carboxypeptidase (penicillin-binding protein 5/6)
LTASVRSEAGVRRARRTPRALAIAAMLLAAAVVVAAALAVHRVTQSPPALAVSLSPGASVVPFPAAQTALAVPAQGSLAVQVSGARLVGGTASTALVEQDASHVRAIGSVAKVMTALVVLDAKPLATGESGPTYTATDADVRILQQTLAAGGSTAPIAAGEVFTERQLLLALLLPSGNNIAESLAVWVAGTRDAFIAKLNARAAALDMTSTHFADPSGFDDATVSTADDLVKLGVATLAQPALADVVHTQDATLPDGTVVHNLDTLLGTEPGWLGIKTGSTNLAGGCLLFASRRDPTGSTDPADALTFIGAVLGQADLDGALKAAKEAVDSGAGQYALVRADALQPQLAGTVDARWGAGAAVRLGAVLSASPAVVRTGVPLTLRASTMAAAAPLDAGAQVGTLEADAGGMPIVRWRVDAGGPVAGPDWTWLLRNG